MKGSCNPADIGTRVKCVSASDVNPESEYICGKSWMRLSREDAINGGYIKSVADIKLGHEEKKVVKKGIIFDSFERDEPDVFGVLMPVRIDVDKVALREIEANYPFSPLRRNFLSFVEITAIFFKVRRKIISHRPNLQNESCNMKPPRFSIMSFYTGSSKSVCPPPDHIVSEIDRSEALAFIFKKETSFVKQFNSVKCFLRLQKKRMEFYFAINVY